MQTLKFHAQVGDDGILKIELPQFRGAAFEALLVLEEAPKNGRSLDWINESYGACADDPIERQPQGEWPAREDVA